MVPRGKEGGKLLNIPWQGHIGMGQLYRIVPPQHRHRTGVLRAGVHTDTAPVQPGVPGTGVQPYFFVKALRESAPKSLAKRSGRATRLPVSQWGVLKGACGLAATQ